MPQTSRQRLRPAASFCSATMMLAAEYQSSDQVKIARRPKRSARKPHRIVPMKRPVNSAAMKLATPVVPNRPARLRRQHARLDETGRDIGRKQKIIELEEHAEAEQHDDRPDRARRRQPVDAGRNRARAQRRSSARVHVFSLYVDRAHASRFQSPLDPRFRPHKTRRLSPPCQICAMGTGGSSLLQHRAVDAQRTRASKNEIEEDEAEDDREFPAVDGRIERVGAHAP